MPIKWEDYNLPSFTMGSTRSQPVPFKVEVPLVGNGYLISSNQSVADLPVYWDVSLTLTDAQAIDFNVFLDDYYAQYQKNHAFMGADTFPSFTKVMKTEVGDNEHELVIIGPRPQGNSAGTNHWKYSFRVYSEKLTLQITPVPDPEPIPPFPSEDAEIPPVGSGYKFQYMPPEMLDTGGVFPGDEIVGLSCARNAKYAIVATTNGRFAMTFDGGQVWNQMPLFLDSAVQNEPPPVTTGCVAMSKTGRYIVAGFSKGYARLSTNYGATFTDLPRGLNVTDGTAYQIKSMSISNDGQTIVAAFANALCAITKDGGQTWTEINDSRLTQHSVPPVDMRIEVSGDGQNILIGIIILDSVAQTELVGKIVYSRNAGATWATQFLDVLNFTTNNIASISMSEDGQHALITTRVSLQFYSNDNFETWNSLNVGQLLDLSNLIGGVNNTFETEAGAVSLSGQYMTIVGRTTSPTVPFLAAASYDFGENWIAIDDFDGIVVDQPEIKMCASSTYWMFVTKNKGYISGPDYVAPEQPSYPTGRNPDAWEQITPRYLNSGQTGGLKGRIGVSADGSFAVYASSSGSGSTSPDMINWTLVSEPAFGITSVAGPSAECVAVSDDGNVAYVCCNNGVAGRTRDKGVTWDEMTRGLGMANITSTIFTISTSADGQTVIAGNQASQLSISYDGGDTWLALANPPNLPLCSAMSRDGQVILVGCYSGPIILSTDGGMNFVQLPRGIAGNITANITSVAIDETGMNMFIVKANGEGYVSHDMGASWITMPVGMNTGASVFSGFECSMSYDGSVIMVGTTSGYVSYSPDSGATWVQLPRGLNSGVNSEVTDIATNGQIWLASFTAGYVSRSLP